MTGKTISTTLIHGVTLNSSYSSPLTIAASGAIKPGNLGGVALYVPQEATLVTIVNHGTIATGKAGYNAAFGLAGYTAVDLESATTFNNTGAISGGTGGSSTYTAGNGGIGINIQAASTVINSGTISGGVGGYAGFNNQDNRPGSPGVGGTGVYLATAATLTNSGVILGGLGGSAYKIDSYGDGGGGGAGVSTSGEGVINNTGLISGGNGNVGVYASSNAERGGDGVTLSAGGTLTNGGTILGGNGGGGNAITGGNGAQGAYLDSSTGSNSGLIEGGTGGYGSGSGGGGGFGVWVNQYGTFNNSGRVVGGSGGVSGAEFSSSGDGGVGIVIDGGGTATNTGKIYGGVGGYALADVRGGSGGDGVYLLTGSLINRGTIFGGVGVNGYGDDGNQSFDTFQLTGNGGDGVQIGGVFGINPGAATNYGVILGGNGGYLTGRGGMSGTGGDGATVIYGSFVNHGTVVGGTGGSAGQSAYGYGTGGAGGGGVYIYRGAEATNTGTIIGGVGGSNIYTGAKGGAGVIIDGGTFVDSGVVRGGAGGVSQGNGAAGEAIYVDGTTSGTLALDPGASFSGLVVANPSVVNVLELTGTATGTLSGIGTEFTGFGLISFASGAQRIIEGSLTSIGDVAGFAAHNAIVLDGYTDNLSLSEVSGTAIFLDSLSSSTSISLRHSNAKDVIIADGGGKTTISGAAGTLAHTIGTSAEQFVLFGGTSTDSKITAGGIEQVENGGTSTAGTIAGGALVLDVGAHITQGVSFGTVTGGKLTIDSATMPTATISGFIAGDTIKLAGVVFNPNDTVTVATAGTVTIAAPGTSYKLNIAGATVGETDFKFGTGSLLTKSAANGKMAFLSPEIALRAPGHTLMASSALTGQTAQDFHLATPAGGCEFAAPLDAVLPHPDPMLLYGEGHCAFTISHNVSLEVGLIHTAHFP